MAQIIRECEICGDDFECDSEDSEYLCEECYDEIENPYDEDEDDEGE